MPAYFLFSVLFLLIACNAEKPSSRTDSLPEKRNSDTLSAILQVNDSIFESSLDAYVEATILNKSHKTYKIKAEELQQAILAVQVFDAQNKLLPTIPPSIPLPEAQTTWIEIKPMEAFIITYDLHIFDPLLPIGKYRVKMKNMPSNQIYFEINKAKND